MDPTIKLHFGDVVQISPESDTAFGGCFMLVTEPKSWGALGFVSLPTERGKLPDEGHCRVAFEDMELVGTAPWVPARRED